MPRKTSKTLTEAELEIMEVLWKRRCATVAEVAGALSRDKRWAYNTVLTFLRILERKGYVNHTKQGRAFVYHPGVGSGEARRSALQDLVKRFFQGRPGLLVQNLLEAEGLEEDELAEIRALLDQGGREKP